MDESEIIFIDDERNARVGSRDHRVAATPPGVRTPFGPKRTRQIVIQGGGGTREPVVVRQVAGEPVVVRQVASEPFFQDRRLFGNLTTSEAVELAAQILASLQPLPVAPVATGRVDTDVENLTLFHAAVALHFKRDEQLRTLGSLLSKLIS